MKTLFALLLAALAVSPCAAQRRDTSWTQTAAASIDSVDAVSRPPASRRIFTRTLTGALGFAVLGSIGGIAGYQATYRNDGGEDPGLSGLLLGAAAGGFTGAALAAALPEQGARCSYGTRAARGLLGAVAATGVYIVAGAGGFGEVVLTFPIGIPLAAAVLADC